MLETEEPLMTLRPLLAALTLLLVPADADAEEPLPPEEPAAEEPAAEKAPPPAPSPYFHFAPVLGAQVFPLGVGVYGTPQLRVSLYRSESKLFQTTHFGIGAWWRVTPAFAEVGPRIDFTPLEMLTLSVTGRYVGSWTGSAGSRIPVAALENKRYATRAGAEGEAVATDAFELIISPTLRLKGGPVIVLYNFSWTHTWLFFRDGDTPQPVYDGGVDLYIAPADRIIQQQAVVLGEILDGTKTKTVLRLGGTVRHKRARVTEDRSVNVGFIGTVKPIPHVAMPDIIVQVLAYVLDDSGERVLWAPNVVLAFRWTFEKGPGVRGIPGVE